VRPEIHRFAVKIDRLVIKKWRSKVADGRQDGVYRDSNECRHLSRLAHREQLNAARCKSTVESAPYTPPSHSCPPATVCQPVRLVSELHPKDILTQMISPRVAPTTHHPRHSADIPRDRTFPRRILGTNTSVLCNCVNYDWQHGLFRRIPIPDHRRCTSQFADGYQRDAARSNLMAPS
jgi:hypothetical protein